MLDEVLVLLPDDFGLLVVDLELLEDTLVMPVDDFGFGAGRSGFLAWVALAPEGSKFFQFNFPMTAY